MGVVERDIFASVHPVQLVTLVVQVEHGAVHCRQEVVPHIKPELQVHEPVFRAIFEGEHDRQWVAEEQFPQGNVQAVQTCIDLLISLLNYHSMSHLDRYISQK